MKYRRRDRDGGERESTQIKKIIIFRGVINEGGCLQEGDVKCPPPLAPLVASPLPCPCLLSYGCDSDDSHTVDAKQPIVKSGRQRLQVHIEEKHRLPASIVTVDLS